MKKITLKILACTVLVATIGFVGMFIAIIVALMGVALFYSPFVMAFTVIMIVFIIIITFELLKPGLYKILLYSFIGLSLLAIGAYELNNMYQNSISTVNERGG